MENLCFPVYFNFWFSKFKNKNSYFAQICKKMIQKVFVLDEMIKIGVNCTLIKKRERDTLKHSHKEMTLLQK